MKQWLCWDEECGREQDADTIIAPHKQMAAEVFAERRDAEGDYTYARYGGGLICVREDTEGDSPISEVEIVTESAVTYHSCGEKPHSPRVVHSPCKEPDRE